jgi:hypothetical protein
LHRIASVHPLSVSREAQPAATRMLVITLRTYAGHPISELAGAPREGASLLNVVSYSVIGWPAGQKLLPCSNTQESTMRKFHSITALCGDGLRPELQALFDRLAIDPRCELFVRDDGMVQAGPDPASETVLASIAPLTKKMPESKWQAALQKSAQGHSRPGRASSKSGHVRHTAKIGSNFPSIWRLRDPLRVDGTASIEFGCVPMSPRSGQALS